MMADREALIARYRPLISAELHRIGFTDDDLRHLGSGGPLTEARFEAEVAELRTVPSGIGAQAYFARFGVDFAAIKREAALRHAGGADTGDDAA